MSAAEEHTAPEATEAPAAKKVHVPTAGGSSDGLYVHLCGVYVKDQEKALKFYTEVLGCTLHTDKQFGPTMRWIEVLPPGGGPTISLFTPENFEDRIGKMSNISFCAY